MGTGRPAESLPPPGTRSRTAAVPLEGARGGGPLGGVPVSRGVDTCPAMWALSGLSRYSVQCGMLIVT